MYVENIHEMYGVQSSKLFFQWGGLTHCDPLSMPSGALLQWLVCASLPGCGWRQPQASLPPFSIPGQLPPSFLLVQEMGVGSGGVILEIIGPLGS